MIRFFQKPGRWAAVFSLVLVLAMGFVLLDTFVFPKVYAQATVNTVPANSNTTAAAGGGEQESAADSGDGNTSLNNATEPLVTATSYQDENMTISVETVVEYDTTYYVTDIRVSDPSLLQTALAGGIYGRNIKQATSEMAAQNGAVLAINGDYYGFRDDGYVIRNGVLYRDTSAGNDALVIDGEGNLSVVNESETTAQQLLADGAVQVLSFGPALVENGAVAVTENQEVTGKSKNSNPRTAIGQVDELHYMVVVSDGRTDESAGLSLYQLAQVFAERGATTAYNLDGGGSSTMVFNGTVVNNTTSGRNDSEREVSDIVFFGYPASG